MKKNDNYTFKWSILSGETAATFSGLCADTGEVINIDIGLIPSGHQKMTGLIKAEWSGYCDCRRTADGYTGVGELVLTRTGADLSKSYAYPVGASGDRIAIGREWKYFDAHHAPLADPAPAELVFDNIPWKNSISGGANLNIFSGVSGNSSVSVSLFVQDVPPKSGNSGYLWTN